MKNLNKIIIVMPILLALLLVGCSLDDPSFPENEVNPITSAEATSQFVSIGNSLTSGYMDSGLMKAGQANSFPMLAAAQMGLDTDTFTQPWVDAPGIGTTGLDDEAYAAGVLYFTGTTVAVLDSTPKVAIMGKLLAVSQPTPYHNLGVPGAMVGELMTTHNSETSYGAQFDKPNSFFDFINRSSFFGNISVPANPPSPAYETASQFGQAIAKGAALTSVFIGGNDFLHGAVSGEPIDNPQITDPATWGASYGAFLGTYAGGLMQRNGFKSDIVVITLPVVDNIPFFLSIADFTPVFGEWDMEESDVEYILITDFLASYLGYEGGVIPADDTLDASEVAYLDGIIGAYNGAIAATIANPQVSPLANFELLDINVGLGALPAENTQHFLYLRAIHASETIAETAARTYFSLDGVHPNNKGYAFLANEFLTAVNDLTGSSYEQIPLAAITWDPTYGVPVPATKAGDSGWPVLSKKVAQGMKDMWQ